MLLKTKRVLEVEVYKPLLVLYQVLVRILLQTQPTFSLPPVAVVPFQIMVIDF